MTTTHTIEQVIRQHQSGAKKVALVCGCFDILHLGHVELFQFAKSHADVLVVGVDNDESVRRSKGSLRPIHPQEVRLRQLQELRSVDHVFPLEDEMLFGSDASTGMWRNLLDRLRPDLIVTHRHADRFSDFKRMLAEELAIGVVFHDLEKQFSTTRIEKLYLQDD